MLDSIPFPFVVNTLVALVVSIILIYEQKLENQRYQQEEKMQRLIAACSAASVVPTRRSRSFKDEEGRPCKHRFIEWDHKRARDCIILDYLGLQPRFDERGFQRMFRLSRRVYNILKTALAEEPFYKTREYNATKRITICMDAKMLIALKHLGYGATSNAWRDYFQMGESTGQLCVDMFCHYMSRNNTLRRQVLCLYTAVDARRVPARHLQVHGIPGMLGSLDCMHVRWKNCPIEYQGMYQGQEKCSTLVLEAVADYDLHFWHAAFGFPGSCNDINIFDASPLHQHYLDGTHLLIDFEFSIGEYVFDKLLYFVNGIYPCLSRFVKTIAVPINCDQNKFACRQKSARNDVECAFGVLQSKWPILANPVEKWDETKIQEMVLACIIMHNMMVEERLEVGGSADGDYVNEYFHDDKVDMDDPPEHIRDAAEEHVGAVEAEIQ